MRKIFLTIAVLFIIQCSEAQLKKFTVEVPYQPKIEIPQTIQSFTIMNRSMTPEFQNYDEKKLQISFYKKNFKGNYILLDSTAADTTIKVLGDLLFDSERFDVVIPVDRNIYRLKSYRETPNPLNWSYVEDICDTYNTDALIVLENLAIRTVTNYDTGTEFDNGVPSKYHYASMDFYSRAQWRIYDPKTKKIILNYTMVPDTLYWDNYDYDLVNLFSNLPTLKEAAIKTAIRIALSFSDDIAPRWISDTRYYYVLKNPLIDKSIDLAADGDWADALNNWLKYADYGKKMNKSKIMLNIALGYEMTGDLNSAIDWLKKSLDIYYREVANYYLKVLLKRQKMQK